MTNTSNWSDQLFMLMLIFVQYLCTAQSKQIYLHLCIFQKWAGVHLEHDTIFCPPAYPNIHFCLTYITSYISRIKSQFNCGSNIWSLCHFFEAISIEHIFGYLHLNIFWSSLTTTQTVQQYVFTSSKIYCIIYIIITNQTQIIDCNVF